MRNFNQKMEISSARFVSKSNHSAVRASYQIQITKQCAILVKKWNSVVCNFNQKMEMNSARFVSNPNH